jgi:hypothetical protein
MQDRGPCPNALGPATGAAGPKCQHATRAHPRAVFKTVLPEPQTPMRYPRRIHNCDLWLWIMDY